MDDPLAGILDRYMTAADGFGAVLATVGADQWAVPTPCAAWTVRDLVNHVARGNLNYAALAAGASAAQFLRDRDLDALGDNPVGAYAHSVRTCATAMAGVPDRVLDYPLGAIPGRQAFAVRTADTLVHTWDLARAVGADDTLDADLVDWVGAHLVTIYAHLAESPVAAASTHRFFDPAVATIAGATRQDRLLALFGRSG